MGDWQNLWPIPYSEIERNVEAVLEQKSRLLLITSLETTA